MDILLIVLLVLVLFGGFGWHTYGSPPWRGPAPAVDTSAPQTPAAPGPDLIRLMVIVLVVIVILGLLGRPLGWY